MNPWRTLPLVRLVFPFIAGTVAGQLFGFKIPFLFTFGCLGAACLALFLFHRFALSYRYRWLGGSVILLAFFLSGFQQANFRLYKKNLPALEFEKKVVLLIRVSECPTIKQNSVSCLAELVSVHDSGRWKPKNTKLYLTVYSLGRNQLLSYGRYYLVYARPGLLHFFTSAHSFNFYEYLFNKGVRYEVRCKSNECYAAPGDHSYSLNILAFEARDRLLEIFRQHGLGGQEFSVAAALLLGYVNEIDSHLKSAFSASGTMHILSVSGMHVGIIFLFLETLLAFLSKSTKGTWLKSVIELLCIWAYAAVTGFSPAVLRAATSLSFLVIGKSIKRKPEMLNVISASVFFLLLIDPLILSDVGFQLSYLAVIGIVILYKPIYDLFVTHYWLPDKVWALIAVSLAAQIATCPLSLYYFHRFPNYFILSNILIVPLSNGIILMGILGLLFASLPLIGNLTIAALKILLELLNRSVVWISSLPGAVSTGFFPDMTEVALLYLLIVASFLFLTSKRPMSLLLVLSCLIILESKEVSGKISVSSRSALSIHSGNQGYVIRFARGRKEICFYSGLRMREDPFIAGQIGNERMAGKLVCPQERWINFRGWQKTGGFPEVGRFGNMIITGERKIYIIDRPLSKNLHLKTHADILLIATNCNLDLLQLREMFTPKVILNVSNASRSRALRWSDQARKLGLKFYNLKSAGFYQEEL